MIVGGAYALNKNGTTAWRLKTPQINTQSHKQIMFPIKHVNILTSNREQLAPSVQADLKSGLFISCYDGVLLT